MGTDRAGGTPLKPEPEGYSSVSISWRSSAPYGLRLSVTWTSFGLRLFVSQALSGDEMWITSRQMEGVVYRYIGISSHLIYSLAILPAPLLEIVR